MFREPLFPAVRGARPGARRLEIRDDTVRGRSRDTTIDDAEAMTIPEARTRARGLLAAASGLPKNTDQRQRRALTPGVGSLPSRQELHAWCQLSRGQADAPGGSREPESSPEFSE